jgi:serine protein kinase
MNGISPRYIQDKLSNTLVCAQASRRKRSTPSWLLNEIENGLTHHSLINDEDTKKRYREMLAV